MIFLEVLVAVLAVGLVGFLAIGSIVMLFEKEEDDERD